MDQYEQAVLDYICGEPNRFVNWQFSIPYDGLRGGSCPDFVVLDFGDKTVYVVEVTCASDSKRVMQRIREKHSRWIEPLRNYMTLLNSILATWEYHITIVVREEEANRCRNMTAQFRDVSVLSLDNVMFSWRWQWNGDVPTNPLRELTKPSADA